MASWFSKILKRARSLGGLLSSDPALIQMFGGGGATSSGEWITEAGALNIQAVYACVRVLSESLAALPVKVYRRTANGKEPAPEHPLYYLLHDEPNGDMTAFEFWELAMVHLCLWGNFYAQVQTDGKGRPNALWPLMPDRMKVERSGSEKVFRYRAEDREKVLFDNEVLHIPGMGFDGLIGYSPIQLQRESLGAAWATMKFSAKLFANGAKPSGILQIPSFIKGDAQKNLRESFSEKYQGADNAHSVLALEENVKFIPTTIPPNDAQFLDTRKLQREEIAGWYRVPVYMIGGQVPAFSIEHQDIGFAKHTLSPWCRRIESRCTRSLFGPREPYFCEFDMRALMRGDAASRAAFYRELVGMGAMKPNEVRTAENMNPVDAGEVFMRPLNTAFVNDAGDIVGQPIAPNGQAGGTV